MQTGLPWQHLVETINDGDQSIRAMDRAPAHAADTDKPGALDHMRERHCTAFIITGMTSLNDRHEGRIDPGISARSRHSMLARMVRDMRSSTPLRSLAPSCSTQ